MSRYGKALRDAFGSNEPGRERTIEFDHGGKSYTATVEVEWEVSDDSFDHEFGTEYLYSWSVSDWELIELLEHGEDDSEEVEPSPELMKAIEAYVSELSAD